MPQVPRSGRQALKYLAKNTVAGEFIPRWHSLPVIILALLIALSIAPALPLAAQGDDETACTALVETALRVSGENCADQRANTICYGHETITSRWWAEDADLGFAPGGFAPGIDLLEWVSGTPADLEAATYGIAALHVQANIPEERAPDGAVRMLMLGDVTLTNRVLADFLQADDPVTVAAMTRDDATLYTGPDRAAAVVGNTPGELPLTLIGVDDTGNWLEVTMGTGAGAWVEANNVDVDTEALATLPVTFENGVPLRYGPMQAFELQTGGSDPDCPAALNALFIQTPPGIQTALNINRMDTRLIGASALFLTVPDSYDNLSLIGIVLEGTVRIELIEEPFTYEAGQVFALPVIEWEDELQIHIEAVPFDPLPQLAEYGIILDGPVCRALAEGHPALARGFDAAACGAELSFPPLFGPES